MIVQDCGIIEYKQAWELQKEVFTSVLSGGEDVLLLCEHPHVYTLGSHGQANNLLINDTFLEKIGATYFKTDRGGDITYHGFGQVVAYPILNVRRLGIGLREYIFRMEEAIIATVGEYGIVAQRLEKATGVWVNQGANGGASRGEYEDLKPQDNVASSAFSKIAAIGVKASKDITMHGLALNVNTDLSYFNHINPCGFTDKGVTSIAKECGREIDFEEVKQKLTQHLQRLLTKCEE